MTYTSDKYSGRWSELEDFYEHNENKMQSTIKQHLISAGITFGSTFLVTFSLAVASDSFTFTKESLLALSAAAIVAGVRGVAKLILEWYVDRKL